jgi:Holliday junction DNA helicase RuvA
VISRVRGTLLRRELGVAEVLTPGGVAYEIEIPLTVYERLPREGADIELRTVQVVREDDVTLYGFLDDAERATFARLLTASGVGPRLALNMLSTLPPDRLVRAIRERDVASLRRIPGLGTKKAERLVVEMADRLDDLVAAHVGERTRDRGADDAVAALVALGYTASEATTAVRAVLDQRADVGGIDLIKAALAGLAAAR